jgi:hypothetical protein
VDHKGAGELVALLQTKEFQPRHPFASASPRQTTAPDLSHSFPKAVKAGVVANNPEVPVVAFELLFKFLVLLIHLKVHVLFLLGP